MHRRTNEQVKTGRAAARGLNSIVVLVPADTASTMSKVKRLLACKGAEHRRTKVLTRSADSRTVVWCSTWANCQSRQTKRQTKNARWGSIVTQKTDVNDPHRKTWSLPRKRPRPPTSSISTFSRSFLLYWNRLSLRMNANRSSYWILYASEFILTTFLFLKDFDIFCTFDNYCNFYKD